MYPGEFSDPPWACEFCGFGGNLAADTSCFVCHRGRTTSPDSLPAVETRPDGETNTSARARRSPATLAVGLTVALFAVAAGIAMVAVGSLSGESPSASPKSAVAGDVSETSGPPRSSHSIRFARHPYSPTRGDPVRNRRFARGKRKAASMVESRPLSLAPDESARHRRWLGAHHRRRTDADANALADGKADFAPPGRPTRFRWRGRRQLVGSL